ncbi:MAG: pyridoxamine 5'-phosphate oxidase [Cyanothece sp. SIO1E1]|nr:pyridoxamine 5'-phosphate oxidase [Cyanothece sp. SIO1E1]
MSIDEMRRQYLQGGLSRTDLLSDPMEQFTQWFQAACDYAPADWCEPNVMTLATASKTGEVTARIVLLKGVDPQGFVFYTNYESQKGIHLQANPRAALVFHWPYLERQVRVEGMVQALNRAESEAYFHSRPRGSQLGAIASNQSQVIASRAALAEKLAQLEQDFRGQTIPMPDYWGGYRLSPQKLEFWQGRANRLHDRFQYTQPDLGWVIERLAP